MSPAVIRHNCLLAVAYALAQLDLSVPIFTPGTVPDLYRLAKG